MRRNSPWIQQGRGRGPAGRNAGPRGMASDRGFGDMQGSLGGAGPGDHLQLHDLDLELALLKRKRELIEQQQTMLIKDEYGSSSSSQYRFDQPREGYGQQFNSMRKYSDLYEERGGGGGGGGAGDRYDRQPSLKRSAHAINVWETNPAPKRPSRPSRPARSPFTGAHQPPPLMATSAPKPRFQPRDRPNFKPSGRINKPRQNSGPNKLNSYPVAERKRLVEQAAPQTPKHDEVLIFDSKKPTPAKVLGRLELALGNILREMRTEFGGKGFADFFADVQSQRTLKQAIRDRIRAVMDGRAVGPCSEIITLYRKANPKTTDLALLNKIGKHNKRQRKSVADIVETGNPVQYFTASFNKILGQSLNNMFQKLQEVYATDGAKVVSAIYDEVMLEFDKEINDANELAEDKKTEGDENTATNDKNAEEKAIEAVKDETTTEDVAMVAENVDENGKAENVTPEVGTPAENGKDSSEAIDAQDADKTVAKDDNKIESFVDLSDLPEPKLTADMVEYDPDLVKARFFNLLVDKLLKRQLPLALPRFKKNLINIIKSDPEFMEQKEILFKKTNEKSNPTKDQEIEQDKPARPQIATADGKPLYVKIVGRPVLPKKKSMKSFLDKFSPILIKKHRNVHNILFVAFDSQENFDNILAENGFMIGQAKLDIKVSEKKARPRHQPQGDANNSQESVNDVSDNADNTALLDDTLDDQITDLLTTIRQEEEKSRIDGDNDQANASEDVENTDNKMETIAEEANPATESTETQQVHQGNEVREENGNEAENDEKQKAENDEKQKDVNDEQNEGTKEVNKNVEDAKNDAGGKGTPAPTRASSRIAASTPRTITTRRASRLGQ